MDDRDDDIAESAWVESFKLRLKEIQGKRSQEDMACLLGVSRDSYNKWVNRGSRVPIRLLPKLAKIGAKPLEWLIQGDKPLPEAKRGQTHVPKTRKRNR